jgi:5-dehydro-4-deoxyglucarate dehydratase
MVMEPDALRSRLQGAIAFPVTPFDENLALDSEGFRRNLRLMLQHPLAAIVVAGGTGELYSLSPGEHLALVREAVEEAGGRIPIIAGTGYNVPLGVRLAKQAADAGAAGILAFPPYYPGADDDGLHAYYRAIADATPLGLLIYSRDWFHPGAAFVERLTEIPTLVAWKEGQGDIRRLQMLRGRVGDRLGWVGGAGDDMVPAYYAIGLRAFTSSIANVAPAIAVQLHGLASAGDAAGLARLMESLVIPLYTLRARRRGYEVTVVKELMNRMGLAGGVVRPPLPRLAPADAGAIDAIAELFKSTVDGR